MMTRDQWAHQLLEALNAPHTDRNAWALVSWMQAEGGSATWNPLNTTMPRAGATNYNSAGVKNYPNFDTGLEATVATLLQTFPAFGYPSIVTALRKSSRPGRTLRGVEGSSWGTGGLALRVLPYVKADYWTFAGHPIAGS